ncbi:MAG: AraC family transcriptional regulator [Spirochaetales bacterium]|nr:AraC family transcriptional regulator [Spirochaetales bacterium]
MNEYIRTQANPTTSALLGVPASPGLGHLTFLHAGHSSWPTDDPGPIAAAERGHAHSGYHALMFTGEGNAMLHDGRLLPCGRGTLVLTDPQILHEYRPQQPGGGSFIEVTFDVREEDGTPVEMPWREMLQNWFGQVPRLPDSVLQIPPPHWERLEGLFLEILGALTEGRSSNESWAALSLGRFALALCDYLESGAASLGDGNGDRLEKARTLLEREFASPLTTGQLAQEACLSEGAFIRSFTSRYGLPPMAYRKKLRITAAQHLLEVSGRCIGEIAANVGYRDIHAFSRTFKAVTGKTASQWRKSRMRIPD